MGASRWGLAFGLGFLLPSGAMTSPLESLAPEHWISLDSTRTDQTTDVATGAGGSMVYISGYKQEAMAAADGSQIIEAFVMAYNSSGVRQWVAEYGSSGQDLGNAIAADATGVFLAGTESVPRNSSGGTGVGAGAEEKDDTDAFVVKYNSTGGVVWKTSWGTSEPDLGNGVAVDGDDGLVYVVGTTKGLMSSPDQAGGEVGDKAAAAAAGADGALAGSADAAVEDGVSVAVNSGMSDVFLTCLGAADGEVRWTRQFGSSAVDVGNRVAVGPRGGVYVVGQLGDDEDPPLAGPRAFLAKYDYLGNSQFTARLNSTSTHYAVDLAPSVGGGGEGVVYMSGYTMGDSSSMFLARFEGSTGAQSWLSHLGEDTGMPHRAQSVAVVEGRQHGSGQGSWVGTDGAVSGTGAGSGAGAGSPAVEGGEAAAGGDARIILVGYNTSVASADFHSSTGFTAAADTNGDWVWYSASARADRLTAVAIGDDGSGESYAYVVGTVADSEASPGNYLFLDIQRVVRERAKTPAPSVASSGQAVSSDGHMDPEGGESSTTGLSQGSSLWLLIIAPIFVVLSCILMVSYVSKQCAIAFGTRPREGEPPMDPIEFGAGGGGSSRGVRDSRSFRFGKEFTSDWDDNGGASASPSSGSADRGRRRENSGKGKRSGAWPRFWERGSEGPPYRKLGAGKQGHDDPRGDGKGGRRRGGRGRASELLSPPSLENGEVEMRQVNGKRQLFDCPRAGRSPGGGGSSRRASGEGSADGGGRETLAVFHDSPPDIGGVATVEWDAFEGEEHLGHGADREVLGLSYATGDRHDARVQSPFDAELSAEGPQQFLRGGNKQGP